MSIKPGTNSYHGNQISVSMLVCDCVKIASGIYAGYLLIPRLKQLVCAKDWYKVKGVLVYDLVTLGTIILGGK